MQLVDLWESPPDEPNYRNLAQDPAPVGFQNFTAESNLPTRFAQVKEGLYRGGIIYPHQLEALYSQGIRHIISLIPWYRLESDRDMTQYLGPTIVRRELSLDKMGTVADKVQELLAEETGSVYVHCLKGSIRTSMAIGAYRKKYDGWGSARTIAESLRFGNVNLSAMKDIIHF